MATCLSIRPTRRNPSSMQANYHRMIYRVDALVTVIGGVLMASWLTLVS